MNLVLCHYFYVLLMSCCFKNFFVVCCDRVDSEILPLNLGQVFNISCIVTRGSSFKDFQKDCLFNIFNTSLIINAVSLRVTSPSQLCFIHSSSNICLTSMTISVETSLYPVVSVESGKCIYNNISFVSIKPFEALPSLAIGCKESCQIILNELNVQNTITYRLAPLVKSSSFSSSLINNCLFSNISDGRIIDDFEQKDFQKTNFVSKGCLFFSTTSPFLSSMFSCSPGTECYWINSSFVNEVSNYNVISQRIESTSDQHFSDCLFQNCFCSSGNSGGALFIRNCSTLFIEKCKFENCSAQNDNESIENGKTKIRNQNAAFNRGGCACLDKVVTVQITETTVHECSASSFGGFAFIANSIEITISNLSSNMSYSSRDCGGCLCCVNANSMKIYSSFFYACSAQDGGGAIFVENAASFDCRNSQFGSCHISNESVGGAVLISEWKGLACNTETKYSRYNYSFLECYFFLNDAGKGVDISIDDSKYEQPQFITNCTFTKSKNRVMFNNNSLDNFTSITVHVRGGTTYNESADYDYDSSDCGIKADPCHHIAKILSNSCASSIFVMAMPSMFVETSMHIINTSVYLLNAHSNASIETSEYVSIKTDCPQKSNGFNDHSATNDVRNNINTSFCSVLNGIFQMEKIQLLFSCIKLSSYQYLIHGSLGSAINLTSCSISYSNDNLGDSAPLKEDSSLLYVENTTVYIANTVINGILLSSNKNPLSDNSLNTLSQSLPRYLSNTAFNNESVKSFCLGNFCFSLLQFVNSSAVLENCRINNSLTRAIYQSSGKVSLVNVSFSYENFFSGEGDDEEIKSMNKNYPTYKRVYYCEGDGNLSTEKIVLNNGTEKSNSSFENFFFQIETCNCEGQIFNKAILSNSTEDDYVLSSYFTPSVSGVTFNQSSQEHLTFYAYGHSLFPCDTTFVLNVNNRSSESLGSVIFSREVSLDTSSNETCAKATFHISSDLIDQIILSQNIEAMAAVQYPLPNKKKAKTPSITAVCSGNSSNNKTVDGRTESNLSEGGSNAVYYTIIIVVACVIFTVFVTVIIVVIFAKRRRKNRTNGNRKSFQGQPPLLQEDSEQSSIHYQEQRNEEYEQGNSVQHLNYADIENREQNTETHSSLGRRFFHSRNRAERREEDEENDRTEARNIAEFYTLHPSSSPFDEDTSAILNSSTLVLNSSGYLSPPPPPSYPIDQLTASWVQARPTSTAPLSDTQIISSLHSTQNTLHNNAEGGMRQSSLLTSSVFHHPLGTAQGMYADSQLFIFANSGENQRNAERMRQFGGDVGFSGEELHSQLTASQMDSSNNNQSWPESSISLEQPMNNSSFIVQPGNFPVSENSPMLLIE